MLQLVYNVHNVIMPRVHISTTHYEIHLQLIFDYDSHWYDKYGH
jgi:hypothetical protein